MAIIINLLTREVKGSAINEAEHDNNLALIMGGLEVAAHENHTHDYTTLAGLQDFVNSKIATDTKGAANGVASLDGTGKVPLAQLQNVLATEDINGLNKGSANGVASLDGTGKVPLAQINGVLNAQFDAKADKTQLGNIANIRIVEATLVAGVAVVSDAGFAGTEELFAFHKVVSGTPGILHTTNKEEDSFTITSTNASDISTIIIQIITLTV